MSDYPPKLILLLDILRDCQPFALRIGDAIILAEALLEEWKGMRERVRLAEDAIANVESALDDFEKHLKAIGITQPPEQYGYDPRALLMFRMLKG